MCVSDRGQVHYQAGQGMHRAQAHYQAVKRSKLPVRARLFVGFRLAHRECVTVPKESPRQLWLLSMEALALSLEMNGSVSEKHK